ncbi:MAG: PEP-CTERM sorting domain-containing protein [Verrucomicrobia bacterium]|nr:PEP-CTERM sorting domain-containing protein [Verrucomicrobiota bacterium]
MTSKPFAQLPVVLIAVLGSAATAQTPTLSSGHADIGIGFEDGAFDLHVHDEDTDTEYTPSGVFLGVGAAAFTTTPAALSALAPIGSSLWVLPKDQRPDLLYLGFGTDELNPADWSGKISLTLTSVSGPGNFGIYDVGAFGNIQIQMNSADGISAGDKLELQPGSHGHYNLTFTAPGTYSIGLQASGTHLTDGLITSDTANYTFTVVPEPGTYALVGLGLVALLVLGPRKQS